MCPGAVNSTTYPDGGGDAREVHGRGVPMGEACRARVRAAHEARGREETAQDGRRGQVEEVSPPNEPLPEGQRQRRVAVRPRETHGVHMPGHEPGCRGCGAALVHEQPRAPGHEDGADGRGEHGEEQAREDEHGGRAPVQQGPRCRGCGAEGPAPRRKRPVAGPGLALADDKRCRVLARPAQRMLPLHARQMRPRLRVVVRLQPPQPSPGHRGSAHVMICIARGGAGRGRRHAYLIRRLERGHGPDDGLLAELARGAQHAGCRARRITWRAARRHAWVQRIRVLRRDWLVVAAVLHAARQISSVQHRHAAPWQLRRRYSVAYLVKAIVLCALATLPAVP
jgi:hypothetical protein